MPPCGPVFTRLPSQLNTNSSVPVSLIKSRISVLYLLLFPDFGDTWSMFRLPGSATIVLWLLKKSLYNVSAIGMQTCRNHVLKINPHKRGGSVFLLGGTVLTQFFVPPNLQWYCIVGTGIIFI